MKRVRQLHIASRIINHRRKRFASVIDGFRDLPGARFLQSFLFWLFITVQYFYRRSVTTTLRSRLQSRVWNASCQNDHVRYVKRYAGTRQDQFARPRLIKESSQGRQGAANEHRCRRVAGGPFDLRGTLAEPLGLEAHSCLLALDSFLTFSTIRDRRIFSRPRQHPRRSDFLRLWDTCTTNSTVSTCINHENRFPLRIRNT